MLGNSDYSEPPLTSLAAEISSTIQILLSI